MSKRFVLVDDIDGDDAEETLTFAVNGVTYEIDLSKGNLTKFHEFMQPYIQNGRRQPAGSRAIKRTAAPVAAAPASAPSARSDTYTRMSRDQNQAIREWANKNGHDLPGRGRIPKHVVDEFNAAHAPK